MNSNDETPRGITRRRFHQLGAAAVVAAATPWIAHPARGDERRVSEIPENAALLEGIQYVPESAKEGQRCANCLLFQPGEDGVGKCQILMQGVVPETAWCVSWAAKP